MIKHKVRHSHLVVLGFACVIAWCIVSAFSRIYTSDLDQQMSPFVLCLCVFSIAQVVFLLLSAVKIKQLGQKIAANKADCLRVNLATFGSWFFLIYPLRYIEPSIVSTISLGFAPIVSLLLVKSIMQKNKLMRSELVISILLLVLIFYIAGIVFFSETSTFTSNITHIAISFACCLIVGFSVGVNTVFSKKLSQAGFSALDTLTVRFIVLIAISAVAVLLGHVNLPQFDSSLLVRILMDAFLLVVIPMYLIYTAIHYLEPFSILVVLPLMPVMVFFMEFFNQRMHPSFYLLLGVLLIAALVITSSYFRYRQEK